MQFIVLHQTPSLPRWMNLLNKLEDSKSEVIKIREFKELNSQYSQYNPTAVFYEICQNYLATVKTIKELFPDALLFSFSLQKDDSLKEQSLKLGFFNHLDSETNIKEIELHLLYGKRVRQLELRKSPQPETLISELTKLHFSLEKQEVLKLFPKLLMQLINVDSFAIYLSTEDGKFLELINGFNVKEPPTLLKLANYSTAPLLVKVAKSNKPMLLNKDSKEFDNEPHFQLNKFSSVMYVPLHTRTKIFGVLEIASCKLNKQFDISDLAYAEAIAISLSVALGNAMHFAQVEHLGQVDDLTQLYNPRYLYQMLETEIKRARRYKTQLSVIFLDLDGFKAVNDNYGHLCGSAILIEVANLMIRLVRDTDIVARYGGDEFVIVLPGTPAEQTVIIAERIRQSIEEHVFRGGNSESKIYLTASFGVACYPEHATSPIELIRCADKAMYLAKELNKNQVVLAS